MKLEWIFFDLGSTLTDESAFEEYFLSTVYELLKAQGVGQEVFHQNLEAIIKERRFGSGGYMNIIRELVRSVTTDEIVLNKIRESYRTQLSPRYLEMQTLYPESVPVIKELKNKYGLGLIANQPREMGRKLKKLGIVNYFQVVALSEEVGYSKPDSRIFVHALKKSRCTAGEALMIGDRLDNDIAPAKSIGMKAVRVKRGLMAFQEPQNKMEEPDHTMSTLQMLPNLLARYRKEGQS